MKPSDTKTSVTVKDGANTSVTVISPIAHAPYTCVGLHLSDKAASEIDAYENLPPMQDDDGATLLAMFSAQSGIRIDILNPDMSDDWAAFFLTKRQAKQLGKALIRWSGFCQK